jgi:hypothetical protein
MNENRTINLIEIPIGGKSGITWNRLHQEREDICESLLKDFGPVSDERRELLQSRLRKVDDALDRLMSGAYGNCSKCGQAIDESKLDMDPALALCLDCWTTEHDVVTSSFDSSEGLKPFDTSLGVFSGELEAPYTALQPALEITGS